MAIMSTMDVQRSWLSKSEACCMAWGLCWNWSAVVSVFHASFIFSVNRLDLICYLLYQQVDHSMHQLSHYSLHCG